MLRDISFTSNFDSPLMEAVVAKFPLSAHGRPAKMGKASHAFVKRKTGVAQEILGKVFTIMHPLRNAWDPIGFGSNKNGIFGATLDDPMHFNESGLFDGVTKAFYGCFTEEELICRFPELHACWFIVRMVQGEISKDTFLVVHGFCTHIVHEKIIVRINKIGSYPLGGKQTVVHCKHSPTQFTV